MQTPRALGTIGASSQTISSIRSSPPSTDSHRLPPGRLISLAKYSLRVLGRPLVAVSVNYLLVGKSDIHLKDGRTTLTTIRGRRHGLTLADRRWCL